MFLYIPDVVVGILLGIIFYHALARKMLNSKKYQKAKSLLSIVKGEKNDNGD